MQNKIDLDALEGLARSAGDQPWQQGRMLSTSETRRWTTQQQEECEGRESRMVFQGFTAEDQGRSRQLVAIFETSELAAYVAEANPVALLSLIGELKAERQALADAKSEITALSKNVIEFTRDDFDMTLNNLRRMGASIDGDNAYKRDLLDSVVRAMAFGAHNNNPPPAGHWGQRFWDIGREERALTEELTEVLKGVEQRCKSMGYVGVDGQYLKVIRAAIAKATQ